VIKPEEIELIIRENCYGAGSGWHAYADILQQKFTGKIQGFTADIYPDARYMLPLAIHDFQQGKLLKPEQAAPVYLRDKVTG
ncbi:MAG TPA: tRNA (adenosine(37)-N6)-threonylcarbamoyltransferase complex dimerization subunit type 1 TsaB, partial [Gammaproteobacteria bacterium]|nr:tRNA (adenosine(37)-N6)-threonylcarbamoyltransferase complex dimerization subunit type 1 TsaB [Gammaproteobacteria bacterium]